MSYEEEKKRLLDWRSEELCKPLEEGLPEGIVSQLNRELNLEFHKRGQALKKKYNMLNAPPQKPKKGSGLC